MTSAQTRLRLFHIETYKILETHPGGVRYVQLLSELQVKFPEYPKNTIVGALHKFKLKLPDAIYMPGRGMYRHTKFRDIERLDLDVVRDMSTQERIKEQEFYKPFADWLVNELEECTKAIALGGNRFKEKWGTPDVIGIRESQRGDLIDFPTEVVSAEIKTDSASLITAFGQACAYKLFSHKSYLVIPSNSFETDIGRLDALARIFGIGLILFNSTQPVDPNFTIRVRAVSHIPDMFYVNEFMKVIQKDMFS